MLAVLVLALAALADCQFAAPAAPSRELFPPSPSSQFAAPSQFQSPLPPSVSSFAAPAAPSRELFPPSPSSQFAAPSPFQAPVSSFAAPAPRPVFHDSGFTHGFTQGSALSGRSGFNSNPTIAVVQRTHQFDDRGQFTSSYSQTDGASVQESGELRPTNDHLDNVLVKKGSYRYTSPDGVPVEVHYTADQYGYHPQGSAIPQAPHSHQPAFH